MLLRLIAMLFWFAALCLPQVVPAERRVALVIGNTNYSGAGRLSNPVNDARDLELVLRKLGFKVDLVLDANKEQMIRARDTFAQEITKDSVAFFYYSGHGVQLDRENYLCPIDVQGTDADSSGLGRDLREEKAKNSSINASELQRFIERSGARLNIMIL